MFLKILEIWSRISYMLLIKYRVDICNRLQAMLAS